MERGPVDVVIIALGEPKFDGSVVGKLERLAGEGTIRVFDAMVVVKAEDGVAAALDIEDQPAEGKNHLLSSPLYCQLGAITRGGGVSCVSPTST